MILSRTFWFSLFALIAVVAGVYFVLGFSQERKPDQTNLSTVESVLPKSKDEALGVEPTSRANHVVGEEKILSSETDDPENEKIHNPYGETPYVKVDATPQTKSLAAIVASGQDLGRLSALGQVDGFDVEKYRNDPKYRMAYLETPISARVFSPAQPGDGVDHIERVSPKSMRILQGEVVLLKVKTQPKMPVTFSSFNLGRFHGSQLTTTTVEADDKGVALAKFEAPTGTAGDVNVIAAGPTTTGQVKFLINVTLPQAVLDALAPQ